MPRGVINIMQRIVEKKKCCGCEACKEICPMDAIQMVRDEDGFFFPIINEKKCINCGVCSRVCFSQHDISFRKIDFNDTIAFGGYCKDKAMLERSSSGGFFGVLAKKIISDGGCVFGVVFSNDFRRVVFTSSDDIDFQNMHGSKYVTASKNGVYGNVKDILITGRQVLFTGLPCEILALYSFLGREYTNLVTCELICAGPSSYNLLDAQIDYLEDKFKNTLDLFEFRYKKYGWGPCSIRGRSGNYSYSKMLDDTIFGVGMKYAKREACFNCLVKDNKRIADFTIGDFWNIDKKSNYYNERGTSVVFTRTKVAKDLLNKLQGVYLMRVPDEVAVNGNHQQLKFPSGIPEKRKDYMECLRTEGGQAAYKKYKPKQNLKERMKNHLPASFYRILRKIKSQLR